jgi:hypothetical protein
MSLPDFLVVGAMKAGTTTLCSDLAANPDIFFPSVKEPHTLVARSFEEESHYDEYRKLFVDAEKGQLCGEGSTGYTKLHKFKRVPERAKMVLGKNAKIIYIVREPIGRIKSHHYHMYRKGEAKEDINEEIDSNKDLIRTTEYASQIKPWIYEFGGERVKVIKFERYVENRKKVIKEVKNFLKINSSVVRISVGRKNKGESHRVPPQINIFKKIVRSQWYKNSVNPRIPNKVKKLIKSIIYDGAPQRPPNPNKDAVDRLKTELSEEVNEISKIYGHSSVMWKSW